MKRKTVKKVGRPSKPSKCIVPEHAIKRLIKEEGAERVSIVAARKVSRVLEDYAREVAKMSIAVAEGKGRSTVREDDVEFSLKAMRGRTW